MLSPPPPSGAWALPEAPLRAALGRRLRAEGRRAVALIGTPDTLQGGPWSASLAGAGVEPIVPSAADRGVLEGICQGAQATPEADLRRVLERLVDQGAEVVLVGHPALLAALPAGSWPLRPHALAPDLLARAERAEPVAP